jgi:hypothetical protein
VINKEDNVLDVLTILIAPRQVLNTVTLQIKHAYLAIIQINANQDIYAKIESVCLDATRTIPVMFFLAFLFVMLPHKPANNASIAQIVLEIVSIVQIRRV